MANPPPSLSHTIPSSRLRLGVFLVLLSATGFAAKGILAKLAYKEGVGAQTVLDLRMLSVLPVYLAGLVWFGRKGALGRPGPRDPDFWKVVLLGLLGFDVSALLDFEGLLRIGAGLERLVLFLYPTFVIFLSALLGRRGIHLREVLASLLAYGGLAIVAGGKVTADPDLRSGMVLVLGSAIFYAVYLVGVERLVCRVDPLYLTSLVMVVATFALLLQSFLAGTFHPFSVDRKALLLIGAIGVFSTALPTFFMTVGISIIGSSRAALLSFFGPVVTLVMAGVFLGERVTYGEGLGALLIMGGVGWVAIGGRDGNVRGGALGTMAESMETSPSMTLPSPLTFLLPKGRPFSGSILSRGHFCHSLRPRQDRRGRSTLFSGERTFPSERFFDILLMSLSWSGTSTRVSQKSTLSERNIIEIRMGAGPDKGDLARGRVLP